MPEGTDPSTAAGTTAGESKTFTQDEVNSFLARETKKIEARTAAAIEAAKTAAAKEWEAKLSEQSARLEELELKGKSAEERERIAADKAAKAIQSERDALTKQLAEKDAALRASDERYARARFTNLVTALYAEAKGLPSMLRHALLSLPHDIEIDFDENDKPTAARIDGVTKTPLDAMKAWLAKPENDGFQQHPGGGSGAQRPNGAGGKGNRLPDDADPAAMLAAGLAEPIRQ